jgi:hypothetical protein
MKNIFQTAAEIGCLAPYLDTLKSTRVQATAAAAQWKMNMNRKDIIV